MNKRTYHVSNLGQFAPNEIADADGYVTRHDHPRYATATDEQLDRWSRSGSRLVRNAAITELANRRCN